MTEQEDSNQQQFPESPHWAPQLLVASLFLACDIGGCVLGSGPARCLYPIGALFVAILLVSRLWPRFADALWRYMPLRWVAMLGGLLQVLLIISLPLVMPFAAGVVFLWLGGIGLVFSLVITGSDSELEEDM
jgi:hypothetical protein